jgi:hypothetical protein
VVMALQCSHTAPVRCGGTFPLFRIASSICCKASGASILSTAAKSCSRAAVAACDLSDEVFHAQQHFASGIHNLCAQCRTHVNSETDQEHWWGDVCEAYRLLSCGACALQKRAQCAAHGCDVLCEALGCGDDCIRLGVRSQKHSD